VHTFEEQPDQPLLRLHRAALEHTDLDNRIARGAVGRVAEVAGVEWEEALEALVGWQGQGIDKSGVDAVGELFFDRVERGSVTVDLDLCH
jgi:hypothetical protein